MFCWTLVLEEEVNGTVNGNSIDDDPTTFMGNRTFGRCYRAWGPGQGPETMPDFYVSCSRKLNNGQPCQPWHSLDELADV